VHDVSAERWLPIPGHEGYEVSDLGRVRGLNRVIMRRDGKPMRIRGQMLRACPVKGYLMIRLGHGRPRPVHRLVLEAFVGPCPEDTEGCHNNGNPYDNRLANLRWDTRSGNMLDKIKHGTNHEVAKTHCPRNHPLAGDNLSPWQAKRGHRYCRACAKAHGRIRRCRERGDALPDLQEESDRMYAEILAGHLDGRKKPREKWIPIAS
jgi:hypothetical protein